MCDHFKQWAQEYFLRISYLALSLACMFLSFLLISSMMCQVHSGGGSGHVSFVHQGHCGFRGWCLRVEISFHKRAPVLIIGTSHSFFLNAHSSVRFTLKASIEEHLQSLYEGCTPVSSPPSWQCGRPGGEKAVPLQALLEKSFRVYMNTIKKAREDLTAGQLVKHWQISPLNAVFKLTHLVIDLRVLISVWQP